MFWGLIVEPGKKYSQKVFQPFHLSQAVLDVTTIKGDPNVQLILSSTDCENGDIIKTIDYILCILKKSGTVQVPLNHLFSEGDDISFRSVGGTVHLSGYSVDERNFRDWSDEDVTYDGRHTDRRQMAQESSDEGDDSDGNSSEGEDGDEGEVNNNSDNDSIEEEQPTHPPPKKPKPNGIPKEPKKRKVVENKTRLIDGVSIEDMRKGKGTAVESGKKVEIYFDCYLQSNNKFIQSHKRGTGHVFTVGNGQVIQGWDIGIVGMRLGGKRKLICPPEKAFGAKGRPPGIEPAIPQNATLVYKIELRRVF